MKAIELMEIMQNSKLAVFRLNDFCRILGKSQAYASVYIHRLKKRNYIDELEKGKYVLKDSNIYAIASGIVAPSYISFLSALSYYRITTQIPKIVTVVTPKSKKRLCFQGYEIEFIKLPAEKIFGISRESCSSDYGWFRSEWFGVRCRRA